MQRDGTITVRGKRGRVAPMLLTGRVVEVIEELISYRERIGMSNKCRYLFVSGRAPDTAPPPLRGSDCVRLFAQKAGAKNVHNCDLVSKARGDNAPTPPAIRG